MEEEFLESEVVFADHYDASEPDDGDPIAGRSHSQRTSSSGNPTEKKTKIRSMPIRISKNERTYSDGGKVRHRAYDDDDDFGDGVEELDGARVVSNGDGKMVPPHVIVAKRLAAKMASSVYTAASGGAHRGRKLCEVRNSILRMTGFLEA